MVRKYFFRVTIFSKAALISSIAFSLFKLYFTAFSGLRRVSSLWDGAISAKVSPKVVRNVWFLFDLSYHYTCLVLHFQCSSFDVQLKNDHVWKSCWEQIKNAKHTIIARREEATVDQHCHKVSVWPSQLCWQLYPTSVSSASVKLKCRHKLLGTTQLTSLLLLRYPLPRPTAGILCAEAVLLI